MTVIPQNMRPRDRGTWAGPVRSLQGAPWLSEALFGTNILGSSKAVAPPQARTFAARSPSVAWASCCRFLVGHLGLGFF